MTFSSMIILAATRFLWSGEMKECLDGGGNIDGCAVNGNRARILLSWFKFENCVALVCIRLCDVNDCGEVNLGTGKNCGNIWY